MWECSEISRPSVEAVEPGRVWIAAALLLTVALPACSTLDPTGEWRGLDRVDASVARAHAAGFAAVSHEAPRAHAVVRAEPASKPEALHEAQTVAVSRPPAAERARSVMTANAAEGAPGSVNSAKVAGPGPSIQTNTPKKQDAGISLEALYMRAEAHYRNRRHDPARQDFEQVLARDPRALHAWFRMGNLHHARGDLSSAVEAYRKAIELTPQNPIEHDSREKSLANLAIISLEQARVALERLGDRQASDAARGRAEALSPLFEERQAALQAELSRFAPRTAPPSGALREGRPGDRGAPILRIESHPPATVAR